MRKLARSLRRRQKPTQAHTPIQDANQGYRAHTSSAHEARTASAPIMVISIF